MQFKEKIIDLLRLATEFIAFLVCVLLVASSGIITYESFSGLLAGRDIVLVVTDALFVVILLELFYVIRSFIKRGSMNVGVIINVGVIASVKEFVFLLDSLSLQLALAFGTIFLSLGILYVLEIIHYEKKKD